MFDIPVQVTVSYSITANAWEPGHLSCTYEREDRSDSWPPDKISGSLGSQNCSTHNPAIPITGCEI
jgi:hypothetical protein